MKYKLIKDNKTGFFRIKALKDIPIYNVKKGDIGGFIEKESNLSHEDNAWVEDNAVVSGSTWNESPLYIKGSKFALTNCKHGYIHIGCLCYSFDEWLKNYEEIGKENNFTDKEIKEYYEYLVLFKKIGK